MDRIENIGGHYAITLAMWREQFLANFDTEIAPALRRRGKQDGKQMSEDDTLIFKRKWEVIFLFKLANAVLFCILRSWICE